MFTGSMGRISVFCSASRYVADGESGDVGKRTDLRARQLCRGALRTGAGPASVRLLPGRVHVLADQVRGVRALPGAELLHAAATHRSEVQVLLLIDADAVHAPQRAGE